MALLEAVLTYRPAGIGSEGPVPVGATTDVRVLRALRDRLLDAAWGEAETWRDIDAGLYAMKLAEAERLGRVLRILLPDEELKPALRVVSPEPTSRREDTD